MDWIVLNEAKVLADFPTDFKPLYDAWLVAHPDKAGRLVEIIEQIVSEPGRVDLVSWAAGANQTADRAALLLCGDVVSAIREVLRAGEIQGGDTEMAVKDLIRWSVSTDHLDLREQLGLATEVAQAQPVRKPAPFPRRPYRPT